MSRKLDTAGGTLLLKQFLDTVHPPMNETAARMLNPLQLAYAGDTIHDLFVRTRLVLRGETVGRMHKRATAYVSAKGQTAIFEAMCDLLTAEEADIARRGRNAHARHAAPKNADPGDYACATGLEALWGYLYLSGQNERLQMLFEMGFTRAFPEKAAAGKE